MEDSISKSRVSRRLRKEVLGLQSDKPVDDITTEDLLVWGILFQENVLITTLNQNFEFNKERFLAQEMANSMFSGMIKTKRIDSESPVEVKDEDKKEDPKSEEEQPKRDKSEDEDKFEKAAMSGSISVKKRDPNSKTPVLDQYGLDMTEKAKEGGYDPLVGREKEISQVIEILCCRKKNNAALLGEAGTGKTAIVEGLAQKISKGEVPMELKGKRIFSISTTDLQAGTIYRGQLEERVQELCNEVRDNDDVIIYIDEFHQAVSEGSSNIAQMLKPSLARGEMNMIISTTISEYRRYIEKDAALKRRFEPVQVEEPTLEETKAILKGIAPQYSKFHHVKITDEVIKACAEWSGQYITDRQFPDKAIGIMDMSSSLTKLENPLDYKKREELQ
jgi:ATP-dependent Clp protease ATP-binding subunit ClpA